MKICNEAFRTWEDLRNAGQPWAAEFFKSSHIIRCGAMCDLSGLINRAIHGSAPVPETTPIVLETEIKGKLKSSDREFIIKEIKGDDAIIRFKYERKDETIKVKDLEREGILDKPLVTANVQTKNAVIDSVSKVTKHPLDCNCDDCVDDYWGGTQIYPKTS